MGARNSLVDNSKYANLVVELLHDIADSYPGTRQEAARCADYVRRRVASEGLKFLTVVLPTFGRALDGALSKGIPLSTPYFQLKAGRAYPTFLWWLAERIFDLNGVELENSDSMAVKHMRQVLYFMYKVPIAHEQQSNDRVIRSFVDTDRALAEPLGDDREAVAITAVARKIIARAVGGVNPHDIDPRHGPGTVSTGEQPWEKWRFSRRYSLIENIYPADRFNYLGAAHLCDRLQDFLAREELVSGTAKVVLVPKDSRGPRLISCEPLEYQYLQQGLGRAIVKRLETSPWTAGHVNFTDQTVNRELARKGSLTGDLVTLDMKDASDRVSFELVARLFPEGLMEALHALRTTHTMLPDGTVMRLNKFAPMGSALCFPVEALVFYALAVASLVTLRQYPVRKALRRVWVYGDDIVCHREDYAVVLSSLPRFHLAFNEKKCCTHGFFRESCGGDFHKGNLVTPLRLKRVLSVRNDASTTASLVDLSNRLWASGYRRCAQELATVINRRSIPYVDLPRENLGFIAFTPSTRAPDQGNRPPRRRFNKELQTMEWKVPTLESKVEVMPCSDWEEMFRCIMEYAPVDLLAPREQVRAFHYTVPHRVALKMRWRVIT